MKLLNCLATLGLMTTCSLFAQENSQTVNAADPAAKDATYIVTANRIKTDVKKIGKSFTIIEREEIEKSAALNILDLIKRTPGIHIAENGPNGTASVFIRGLQGYHTKFLINGTQLADVSGTQVSSQGTLNLISLDQVERIEIIRGGQSVLHGSDAIGGVINIITRQSTDEKISGSLKQDFGSHQYQKTTGQINGTVDGFTYALSGFYENEETFSTTNSTVGASYRADDDGFSNKGGSFRLGYQVNEHVSTNISGIYLDADQKFDNSFGGQFNHLQQSVIRPEIKITDLFEDFDLNFAYSHADTRRSSIGSEGETHRYELVNSYHGFDSQTWTFGIDFQKQRARNDFSNTSEFTYTEFFIQNQIDLTDNYNVTLGARHSEHDSFGGKTTFQVSQILHFDEIGLSFKNSFGTSYRAPSPNEISLNSGINLAVQPETGRHLDFGFDQEIGDNLSFGATAFYNEIRNYIDYDGSLGPLRFGFPTGAYFNTSRYETNGFEAHVHYSPFENLQLQANYTRTETDQTQLTTTASVFPQGVRRPQNAFNFIANYQPIDELNLQVDLQYNGTRDDGVGFPASQVKLEKFVVVNLASSYQMNANTRIFARVNNLFDEDYEYVRGFNTYGRTVYGGIELSF